MEDILFSIGLIGSGGFILRQAILDRRPKKPHRLGFDKKVNWDNFGRQMTGLSGLILVGFGLLILIFTIIGILFD